MDRFDNFLKENLRRYLELLQLDIIDEIIVSDENGEDARKIEAEYGNHCGLYVYQNESRLGVFKNKMRAASYAKSGNFVALIDSDNFADEYYFQVARNYIIEHGLTADMPLVLAPVYAKYRYEYPCYKGFIFNVETVSNLFHQNTMLTFLNTANYIITKTVDERIRYSEEELSKLHVIDVIYKHILAYQQIPGYKIHAVPDLEYFHEVHKDSYFITHYNEEEIKHQIAYCENLLRAIVANPPIG